MKAGHEMKIEHLEEHIAAYRASIKMVVDKRLAWKETTKPLIAKTLNAVQKAYDLGWSVQNLKWMQSNEAVNITFDSFPPAMIDCTNLIPAFQFMAGGALVFSQSYNGDILIFMLYPENPQMAVEESMVEFGSYVPEDISEKLIIEKVDEFLKAIIQWEVPSIKKKLGY